MDPAAEALFKLIRSVRTFEAKGCTSPTPMPSTTRLAASAAAGALTELLASHANRPEKPEPFTLKSFSEHIRKLDELVVLGQGMPARYLVSIWAYRNALIQRTVEHLGGPELAEVLDLMPQGIRARRLADEAAVTIAQMAHGRGPQPQPDPVPAAPPPPTLPDQGDEAPLPPEEPSEPEKKPEPVEAKEEEAPAPAEEPVEPPRIAARMTSDSIFFGAPAPIVPAERPSLPRADAAPPAPIPEPRAPQAEPKLNRFERMVVGLTDAMGGTAAGKPA